MKTTLLKFKAAWPLAIFLLLPALTRAETAVQVWVQRYSGPGNSDDYANAVAVDTTNNIIVTGYSYNGTKNDYTTIAFSSAGTPLWTNRYNNGPGETDDRAVAMAVDGSNNVIVTGYSVASGSRNDYATIAYSSAGVPLWTNRYNGPATGGDTPSALAVDRSNNVIVTGASANSSGAPYDYDYLTIAYSSAGVPLWTNRYNGPANGDDGARALAVDGSNNVIVTGSSMGSGSDYATIKYSSAGVPLWTKRYSGPGNYIDAAYSVAVDGSNNVIVAGYSFNGANFDYVTIKYSGAGVPLWTNGYNAQPYSSDYGLEPVLHFSRRKVCTL